MTGTPRAGTKSSDIGAYSNQSKLRPPWGEAIGGVLLEFAMASNPHRLAWRTLLAFAIIYVVWGSTFLAIRIGVQEVPPFLLAAMRFLVAGVALYGWMLLRGERSPTARQWMSAFLLAVLIFVLDYGLLFWAERRVPSGITAVMMATIPVFMAL